MAYQTYLFGSNEEMEQAFLEGCRTMMDIFAHANSDQCSAIWARKDHGWIMFLCEQERLYQENQQRKEAEIIAQNYRVDKRAFRGMLLDKAYINDLGEEVDEEGNICTGKPYPRTYCSTFDWEKVINAAEYAELTPIEQDKYLEMIEIQLVSKIDPKRTMLCGAYNQPLMEALLKEILPYEPEAVLKLYKETLENGPSGQVIQNYADIFKPILSLHSLASRVSADFEQWLNGDEDEE